MCSIVASYSKEKLEELIEKNQFRGNFSYSYTELERNGVPHSQLKGFGKFPHNIISEERYKISHVQAPTGGMIKDHKRIHPTEINLSMLWHNGLITPRGIKFLQNNLNSKETFDTLLIHKYLEKNNFNFSKLSEIEGLFSCLMLVKDTLYIFRTKHGQLWIDKNMNISSVEFENSFCIPYDKVYKIDFQTLKLIEKNSFKTKRFNFIIKESERFEELL